MTVPTLYIIFPNSLDKICKKYFFLFYIIILFWIETKIDFSFKIKLKFPLMLIDATTLTWILFSNIQVYV